MRKFTDTKQKSYAAGRRKKNARKAAPAKAMKLFVKRGDTVMVISGKDKGKQGEVLTALPKLNRVVVDGVNMVKRSHRRTGRAQSGRIVEKPASIHASNVKVTSSAKRAK